MGLLPASTTTAEEPRLPDGERDGGDSRHAVAGEERQRRQRTRHQAVRRPCDWQVADDLRLWSNKLYLNEYKEEDRKITFTSYAVGNAPRQRRQWDETQTGLISTLTAGQPDLLAPVDGGINYEQQDRSDRRYCYNYRVPHSFLGHAGPRAER